MTNGPSISRRFFIALPLGLMACSNGPTVLRLSGQTMGTNYNVVAIDHTNKLTKGAVETHIAKVLADVDQQFSNWNASSELTQLNQRSSSAPMTLSEEMNLVLSAAARVNQATDGYFDVATGSLIDAWGFGAGKSRSSQPSQAQVQQALAHSGQTKAFRLTNGQMTKLDPAASIYLSSIGKGRGVDRLVDAMTSQGLSDFMVEIGGDLHVAGLNSVGEPWQIGIEKPDAYDRTVQTLVRVSNKGLATSGDYRNFFTDRGQDFSHILNPRTGSPIQHGTASVTVVAENAMMADAWSTALLAMGTTEGLELAEKLNIAAMFMDRDGKASDKGYTLTNSTAMKAYQA